MKKIKIACDKCEGKGTLEKYEPAALRARRKELGVGVRDMARQLGLSAPFISDVELGRRNPNEKIIAFLSE